MANLVPKKMTAEFGDDFKVPACMEQQRLEKFSDAIIKIDTTPEAVLDWLSVSPLNDSESILFVDFLNTKAQWMMYGEYPVKMLQYSERAFLIADRMSYEKGKANSLLFTGVSQWLTSDLGASLKNLLKAKHIFRDFNDDEGQMKALAFEACVYRSMGDYDQSYLDLRRSVEYFRKSGNTFWEAIALLSLAMTCEQIGDFKGVHSYNQRIIKIVTEPELQWIVGRALDGIGTIYYNWGQYKKAIENYEKSLTTCRTSHHLVGEARALNDLGMAYQQLGDMKKSNHYYLESLRIRKQVGQREAQCTCLFNLGKLSMGANQPEVALEYFNEALFTAMEVDAKPRISQAYKNLSDVYEMTNDFVKALHHYKLFQKTNEEVASQQNKTRIKNLKTRLELDKAEEVAQIERLKNVKLNEKNTELNRLINELHEAQVQLVQSEKMAALGKLIAGVSHEMNSPLGASTSSIDISNRCITKIMDLLESDHFIEGFKKDNRLEKLLSVLQLNNNVVSEANERISKIVRSLKSFSNLDEAQFQKTDIHEGLDSTITLLEAELSGNIRIIKRYGALQPIACYPGELNQVFLNLFTNSAEAIEDAGEIVVQTSIENEQVCIKISDNGIGIPAEKIKTLFDPAFTKAQTRVKAGMGLFISQNIIKKHKGHITVTSEVDKGACFSIVLPVDLDVHANNNKQL